MTPSKYQEAIYKWVQEGTGNAVVEALAGSGKTTCLVEASKLLPPGDVLFIAFNKHIVEELRKRLPSGATVQTLNSLGHQALGRHLFPKKLVLDNHKYDDIILQELKENGVQASKAEFSDLKSDIRHLIHYVQASLAPSDNDSLDSLAAHYGMDLGYASCDNYTLFKIVRNALDFGESVAAKTGVISYSDQIYLPVKWGIRPTQTKFLMIDEVQDLTVAQLKLALATCNESSRILATGDSRQSIYAFSGASHDSFQQIKTAINGISLPLNISYRCPKKVVELAQRIVPQIECSETALEGTVGWVEEETLTETLQSGDMVLCRLTAPLVSLCIELIGKGIPAKVKGRDIGKNLVSTAKKALGKKKWVDFPGALEAWQQRELAKLHKKKHPEEQISSLQDRVAGIRACYEGIEADSFESWAAQIEQMFSDDKSHIHLMTVHKAKGLEADTVYIIKPEKMPLKWKDQQAWEYTQEINIQYVAQTRAKERLFFVRSAPKDPALKQSKTKIKIPRGPNTSFKKKTVKKKGITKKCH